MANKISERGPAKTTLPTPAPAATKSSGTRGVTQLGVAHTFSKHMTRLFDEFWSVSPRPWPVAPLPPTPVWYPRAELLEWDGLPIMRIDLPNTAGNEVIEDDAIIHGRRRQGFEAVCSCGAQLTVRAAGASRSRKSGSGGPSESNAWDGA